MIKATLPSSDGQKEAVKAAEIPVCKIESENRTFLENSAPATLSGRARTKKGRRVTVLKIVPIFLVKRYAGKQILDFCAKPYCFLRKTGTISGTPGRITLTLQYWSS